MKKEKFEKLSFEEKRNYTKKKLQKSYNVCLGIVLGGMCSLLAGTFFYLGSMGASTANWSKAKEKGYEVFNQNYRVEQQTKLYEQFQNGEISKQQYLDKSEHLEDYDYKKFMYENATAEELKEFKKVEKVENGLVTTGHIVSRGGAAIAFASIATLAVVSKKADKLGIKLSFLGQKNKDDKIYSESKSIKTQKGTIELKYKDYPEICESMTTYVKTDKGEYVEVDSSSGTKKKIDEKTL